MASGGRLDDCVLAEALEIVLKLLGGPVEVIKIPVLALHVRAVLHDHLKLLDAAIRKANARMNVLRRGLRIAERDLLQLLARFLVLGEGLRSLIQRLNSRDTEGAKQAAMRVRAQKIIALLLLGRGDDIWLDLEKKIARRRGLKRDHAMLSNGLGQGFEGVAEDDALAVCTRDGKIGCEKVADELREGLVHEQIVLDRMHHVERAAAYGQRDCGACALQIGVVLHVSVDYLVGDGRRVSLRNAAEFAQIRKDRALERLLLRKILLKVIHQKLFQERVQVHAPVFLKEFKQLRVVRKSRPQILRHIDLIFLRHRYLLLCVTFVTSLPWVGIMECCAFQALLAIWGVPLGVTFVTSLPAVGIMECCAFQAMDVFFLARFAPARPSSCPSLRSGS